MRRKYRELGAKTRRAFWLTIVSGVLALAISVPASFGYYRAWLNSVNDLLLLVTLVGLFAMIVSQQMDVRRRR